MEKFMEIVASALKTQGCEVGEWMTEPKFREKWEQGEVAQVAEEIFTAFEMPNPAPKRKAFDRHLLLSKKPLSLYFQAEVKDKIVWRMGSLAVPLGKPIAEALRKSVSEADYNAKELCQRDYYAWEFAAKMNGRKVLFVVQDGLENNWLVTLEMPGLWPPRLEEYAGCMEKAVALVEDCIQRNWKCLLGEWREAG
jgi:hypothetical protein